MGKRESEVWGKSTSGRENSKDKSPEAGTGLTSSRSCKEFCMTRGASNGKGEGGEDSGGEQEPELSGACTAGKEFALYSHDDRKPPDTFERGNELERFTLQNYLVLQKWDLEFYFEFRIWDSIQSCLNVDGC